MKINIPAGARYIINELTGHGYEAYIVGGCVRDSLLGKQPNDWDITTSATPFQVKEIFHRTVDTGIQHGTVTVLVDKKYAAKPECISEQDGVQHTDYAYEVTTYRVDGKYEAHRRPKEVTFTISLEEDLKRRDFTINAMAYNDEQGIIDIFGGQEDLRTGVIRCVGSPTERFGEDALRILRAVRFAAQLGFKIDAGTRAAMREQGKFLRDISAERIQVELTKLLLSDHPDMLAEAYELGLTQVFLPEFDRMMETEQNNPYHKYTVGIHTVKVIEHVPKKMILRYAALLHDVGKPDTKHTGEDGIDHFYGHQKKSAKMANVILRRLKLDNHTIAAVCNLVLNHDYGISGDGLGIRSFRRFLASLGKDNFEDFIALRKADMAGQSDYNLESRNRAVNEMEEMYRVVMEEQQCIRISDLAISGRDLIGLGMKPGRDIGNMLNMLLERVLDEPEQNSRERLLQLAKSFMEHK